MLLQQAQQRFEHLLLCLVSRNALHLHANHGIVQTLPNHEMTSRRESQPHAFPVVLVHRPILHAAIATHDFERLHQLVEDGGGSLQRPIGNPNPPLLLIGHFLEIRNQIEQTSMLSSTSSIIRASEQSDNLHRGIRPVVHVPILLHGAMSRNLDRHLGIRFFAVGQFLRLANDVGVSAHVTIVIQTQLVLEVLAQRFAGGGVSDNGAPWRGVGKYFAD
mmetsp:Transcript_22115/g.35946  ORF Transcript_22115/g.35946 Transcript_22115/m.35946 type:complete len:218 (-) Transcript_22115:395-1048(-)